MKGSRKYGKYQVHSHKYLPLKDTMRKKWYNMETKICKTCEESLPITSYYKAGMKSDGNTYYEPNCKHCREMMRKPLNVGTREHFIVNYRSIKEMLNKTENYEDNSELMDYLKVLKNM